MSRNPIFSLTTLLLGCFVLLPAFAVAADKPDRPNIVFILADDLGWRDLGCTGSSFYESPNIDSIAAAGMSFTRGYAACCVCSPSRASVLTGRYPAKHGITTWIGDKSGKAWIKKNRHTKLLPAPYEHQLGAKETTLAEALRQAGYTTFFAGKWHLGGKGSLPTDHGFDINRGGWSAGSPRGGYFAPWQNPYLPPGPDGESLPLRLGRETAKFIKKHQDEPFLAYLSFYSVHSPIQTDKAHWRYFRDKAVAADRADWSERFQWDRRMCVRQVQDNPIYAGVISSMDQAVGIVLDQLAASGLEENTIVCFTSDNGGVSSGDAYSTCNLPLRGGKGRQWEGGVRVPFIINAPGMTEPDSRCNVPVSGIDWYPTLLDLAGVPLPKGLPVDGVSLVPLLAGGHIADRPLYWHYPHYGNQGGEPSSILRQGDWKLIRYHEDGRNELYQLAKDPGEQQDVAGDQPERTMAMRRQLDARLEDVGARFPEPNPKFDPEKRAKRLERMKTDGQKRLEKRHAGYLDDDFQPNASWWDSEKKGNDG